jgi:hypothetical protein
MQAFTPRRLTARPAESEHLSLQSTTPHYLVNSNKVCANSFYLKRVFFPFSLAIQFLKIKASYIEKLRKKSLTIDYSTK